MKDKAESGIPKKWLDMIGTKQKIGKHVFSHSKSLPYNEYDVLDVRFGSGQIMNMKTFECIHPTIQLLLKREGMKKAMWSKGFPCREITLKNEE